MTPIAGTLEALLALDLPPAIRKGLVYLSSLEGGASFGQLGGEAVKVCMEGDDLFALLQTVATKTEEEAKYEVHHKYWDIQYLVEGEEVIRTTALVGQAGRTPYDAGRDIAFYAFSAGEDHLLKPGMALLIPPGFLHAPCISSAKPGVVRKVVVKVASRLAPPRP